MFERELIRRGRIVTAMSSYLRNWGAEEMRGLHCGGEAAGSDMRRLLCSAGVRYERQQSKERPESVRQSVATRVHAGRPFGEPPVDAIGICRRWRGDRDELRDSRVTGAAWHRSGHSVTATSVSCVRNEINRMKSTKLGTIPVPGACVKTSILCQKASEKRNV